LLLGIRTLPSKQYAVRRAFNGKVKRAFDKYGITMRDPSPMSIISPPEQTAQRPEETATPELRCA